MNNDEIKTFFQQHNGVVKTKELKENKIYYNNIQQLISDGVIEKIGRGIYQLCDENLYAEIPLINTLFPNGIICRESALFYYGYINRTPNFWHIAVESSTSRIRSKEYSNIKLHFMNEDKLNIGKTSTVIDGFDTVIYDRERVICDCLAHRNKMDVEEFNNTVKNYISDPERNITKLMEYAKILKVEKKVHEVISIWL